MGFYDEKGNLLNAESTMNSVTARFNEQLNQFDKQILNIANLIYKFRKDKVQFFLSEKEPTEQGFNNHASIKLKEDFNINCSPENVDAFIVMYSEKARPVLDFIENYKRELLNTYMKYSSALRCAISDGSAKQINAVHNRENQFKNEMVNGIFASSGFSDLENYIGRAATIGKGMTVDNSVVVYPDSPFKDIEEQQDNQNLLLQKNAYVYSMDASKFEPVVDFEIGRDGKYSLYFGQEWISRNESLECEKETIDRVPRDILERKQIFYKKQKIPPDEIKIHSQEEFLDKYSKLIASGRLGYINGEFNINNVINKQSDERNLEEAYDKLSSTDIQKTKSLVNISKGLFKEDDLIKVFSGAHDIYFNIDRESIISITKNVLDKFDKNNYADNRDFNYMIDLLNIIQSEVTKFFGTKKENRMAYYYNNGRIPSDDEDTRICSMSQIKGKGIAKCAEKASCVNNILQLLHEIDVFPYDVSYLNLITQIGDNSPDGHAILEFPRTNKDGEIIHFLYDITNPERVEYLGEKYAYPAIYSLNDKEYEDFIEHGTPFNNKSKFIMRDWYKPTEDRAYLGFQSNDKALIDNYINDIINRIDKSLSKKDIVKFVHIELGKVLMYDNSYTEKYTKEDNAEMTQMSKERREKLLYDATSLDSVEQICKGMAEISAAIFNKLGIDAKVVGAEEKGEVDGAINEKTNETIVVPKIYTSKFIGSRIVTGDNEQTKQTDAKAKHYYTVIDIDEEEPIIQDYVMEKALTRIKIGETTVQDENIPGLCLKSEYNDRVSHEMTIHEDFKQRIESELIAQYGENSSFDDRFKFIFETLQKQEKNLGTDEAINYARFMSEILIGIDNLKEMNKSGKFKFVNLVKETNDHSDLVCIYSLNGQNYFVRGNNERFRKTASNWRNIRKAN